MWITSFIATSPNENISMLHRTRAGTWTSTVLNVPEYLGITSMRQIPGTGSLWAGRSVLADADTFAVLLKYGP